MQFQSLQEANASRFEITSNQSRRLDHLSTAFKVLAVLLAEHLPGEAKTQVTGILRQQTDLALGLEQKATEVLDAVTADDLEQTHCRPVANGH